jgi:hypothetical protein
MVYWCTFRTPAGELPAEVSEASARASYEGPCHGPATYCVVVPHASTTLDQVADMVKTHYMRQVGSMSGGTGVTNTSTRSRQRRYEA